MLHLKLIACKVLQRELGSLAFRCPNAIDITTMRQRYHNTPVTLTQMLQEEIDRIDANDDPHTEDMERRQLDAILLGYGLCSNAVIGLHSKKHRIVIPKAHDCATLVMGSREAYDNYFTTYRGSFFTTRGWRELGATLGDETERLERLRQEYMEKYDDEDTVDYLMEMEYEMVKNYSHMTYVRWPELLDEESERHSEKAALDRGWQFHIMEGSDALLRDLLWGNWDEDRFLILEPGQTVAPAYDGSVIKAADPA